jgi:vitamin-K-epoxide reductase (warfarin-sensitive)
MTTTKTARTRTVAAVMGLILSAYAVYVEYRVAHKSDTPEDEPEFVALCDIAALGASCSNVFTLPQGRMLSYFGIVPEHSVFDLPNAALGMIHYMYLLTLRSYMPKAVTNFMIFMGFASTVFLAYQLTFVLFELCILCWSTHVINTYNFYSYFFSTSSKSKTSTTKKRD